MSHVIIISLYMAAQPIAGVPQSSLAAGQVESIFEVLKAAKRCHVDELKIGLFTAGKDEARLFLQQVAQDAPVACLNSWLTLNGKRLHLQPRWWKDDFTKDRP